MKTTSKLAIIGLVFIITISAFIWGFNYLKGNSLFKKNYIYYAVYKNVGGLTKGSAVTLSGYQIGQITDIYFTDDKVPKLIVRFILEKDVKIPKKSVAEIYSTDLMGTKGIRLIFNPATEEYYEPGDTLVSAIEKDLMQEVNEQIMPLKIRTEQLLASFDSVLILVQALFSKNESNIYSSINNINLTIRNLEHTTFVLDTMISKQDSRIGTALNSLKKLALMLDKSSDTIASILANIDRISDSLANANLKTLVYNTKNSLYQLNAILEKINKGQGTLGQLVNNDSLYITIQELTDNINYLLEDIRENPKRYINISFINLGKYYQTSVENKRR